MTKRLFVPAALALLAGVALVPALLRAEKLLKKARRAKLETDTGANVKLTRREAGRQFFALVALAQRHGWSAEDLLRDETQHHERAWRKKERQSSYLKQV